MHAKMKRICDFTNNEQKPAYHWVSGLNFRGFFAGKVMDVKQSHLNQLHITTAWYD
jgi:hypothetical protein